MASVYRHRFLTAEHVRYLHFEGSSVRAAQLRLRTLWSARLLDRTYLQPDGMGDRDRYTERPLYSLASRGGAVVAAAHAMDIGAIPHTPAQNREGFRRIRHNLAATDFLVAVEAACARLPGWSAAVIREHRLAAELLVARRRVPVARALLPDGAVTVSAPGVSTPQTYLIEIVRAGVKAGNDTIRRRLHRYRAALRAGFFRSAYGFAWVRAVVFLTPTVQRARTLAGLARDVLGGEGLFRFGAYEERVASREAPIAALRPDTVATSMYLTASGKSVSLFESLSITSTKTHV